MLKTLSITVWFLILGFLIAACSNTNFQSESDSIDHKQKKFALSERSTLLKKENDTNGTPAKQNNNQTNQQGESPEQLFSEHAKNQAGTPIDNGEIQVVAKPESIPVLVNKHKKLPDSYTPDDLINTNIPFFVAESSERRKMRKEAAGAIEKLFAGARSQGIQLLGVSAYRSHTAQVNLFNFYVKSDGYEKARTYSALPGTSEHETGLAIDVTGGNGQCPAQECFGKTKEAKWLQEHAADYGFIIRYPKGKDAITGYKYEPWHLRYVGSAIAKEIMSRDITLEEYYHAVPVTQKRNIIVR